MTDRRCPTFERYVAGRLAPTAWETHRAGCRSCQAQAALDDVLRSAMAGLPLPAMQPDFSRRLFDEVAWTRRLAQPGTSWLTWGLRLNGVAAVALGVVILARIDGPASGYAAGALLSVVACGDWLAQCFGVELFDA